jgi:hypothetical protein
VSESVAVSEMEGQRHATGGRAEYSAGSARRWLGHRHLAGWWINGVVATELVIDVSV